MSKEASDNAASLVTLYANGAVEVREFASQHEAELALELEDRPSAYDVRLADPVDENDGIYEVQMVFSVDNWDHKGDRVEVAQQAMADTFPFLPAPTRGIKEELGPERADFFVVYHLDIDQLRQLSQFVEIEEMADIETSAAASTPYIPDFQNSDELEDFLEDHPAARAFVETGLGRGQATVASRVEDARFEALSEYQQSDVLDLVPSLLSRFGGNESEARAAAIAVIETEEHYEDLGNRIREARFAEAMAESERRFIDGDDELYEGIDEPDEDGSRQEFVEETSGDIELEARLRTTPGHPARTPEEIEAITEAYYRDQMEGLGL